MWGHMFQSPDPWPERLLVFGDAGTGKSYISLCIAKHMPEVKVRIAEVDWTSSAERLMTLPEFKGLKNVEIEMAYPDQWDRHVELGKWLHGEAKPGDWSVFDSLTHTWPSVQEWFIDKFFGTDPDAYWVKLRADSKNAKANGFDGWQDWPYIKKQHDILYRMIAKNPSHVLLTAEQAQVMDEDKKDDRQTFAAVGYRPAGRKQMAHLPAMVGMLTRQHDGSRQLTTVKERGRELVTRLPMMDFFEDYLVGVAGWKEGK
jgi:hypothetical protein